MDKQQVPPSYGLFLLGKKQKKQVHDSTSELSQSNASSRDYEPPGGNYRNTALTNGGNTKPPGYHEANHNNLLNEVRSQLSDLRDLLSSSKGSEVHEASVESSDLRITDEQLAQMAPKERALFLQRIPELQNELFSEGVSSSMSVGDTTDGTLSTKKFQPQISAAKQAVHTPTSISTVTTTQQETLSLQPSKNGPPRMARLQTGTPNQKHMGNDYISIAKTSAGSSFAIGDDSRRSAFEQPRVISIQRANLEVDNTSSLPNDVETSVESDFSTSDVTDVIEANLVLPPRLPQPAPPIHQRSTSSKRSKTPSEPRTVIQRVKPEIDDVVLPPPETSAPCDSEVDLNEYDAKLTVQRRPQSAGGGLADSNRNSPYTSAYGRPGFQSKKSNASFGTQNGGQDDSEHSDLNILSSNAAILYTKQSRSSAKGTPTTNYNRNMAGLYGYTNTNESYDDGVRSALRSNPNKTTLKSPGNGRQNTRLHDSGSFDDDIINNVHAATSNFIKLPKQPKQAPLKPEDSEPDLVDVMTIPESTVLYNPKQHRSTSDRYVGTTRNSKDQLSAGRKSHNSISGAVDDDHDLYNQHDNTYEHTNVLSIQREPLMRSKLHKDAGDRITNASRYENTSIPNNSGYYADDINIEDDIQETKLFISAADAGRSRLVSDKSIGEKKHKRQHQGPNHTIVTQLAQYETKPRDQTIQNESDEEYSSSDPEVTISKLVYPKLTPAEQQKLRRLAEVRSKQPKTFVPDVHVYGRPKTDELEFEGTNHLQRKDNILSSSLETNLDNSHLYSNVTPYYQYKKQLVKNAPNNFMKGKTMKDSISDDTPAQEVTQFVNSKYLEMGKAAGIADSSILPGYGAKSIAKGTTLSSALHIRSDTTLGDIARSGRKFVMARKEESVSGDLSRAMTARRDGYTQRDDSSDSEPQYEDMTILPAAEPYYGLPQPDFESFNHSIQSMRQSLLMRSSNTQSTSLTENQFDDRLARAKEAIRVAERQNGLSPSVLTTGSLSTNWMQTASPTAYQPQVISPAAHPRIRPTSRSHPPAPEPPLPDPRPEGGQVSQATIQRMNAMSDMVMPDRTASASSTSSGASGTLMQQLQKYGTIDPKIGLQSTTGIPRSGKTQATPRPSGSTSQSNRGSRPGQSQSSGRPGSMSGPRPSKRMYLQATTLDPDNVVEAVALAEYIIAQNQISTQDSSCSNNMAAVLSDLQLIDNRKPEDLQYVSNTTIESDISRDYATVTEATIIQYDMQHSHYQSIATNITSTNSQEIQSTEQSKLYCMTTYNVSGVDCNHDIIENLNATVDIIANDIAPVHNAKCDLDFNCLSSSLKQAPHPNISTIKIDLTIPNINIELQSSVSNADEVSFTSNSDTDIEFAAPEYMLKPQTLVKASPHILVSDAVHWEPDSLYYALTECQPHSRPLLLETRLKTIWNFPEDTLSTNSVADSSNSIESWTVPNFFFSSSCLKNLQTSFAVPQPKKDEFSNLGQNRRSSFQYYKNAQLLLYGFVPDGSTEASILQSQNSRHKKFNSIHSKPSLLTPCPANENKIDSYDNEKNSTEHSINQTISQNISDENSFLKTSCSLVSDQNNKCVTSIPQLCDNLSSQSHVGLNISNSETRDSISTSINANMLTANSMSYDLINSNPRPISIDSEEMDISLIETLKPPIDTEAQIILSPKVSREFIVQQNILNNVNINLLQENMCIATSKIKVSQISTKSDNEDTIRAPFISRPFPVSSIPLYTTDPFKTEVTQHLFARSQWYFAEDSVISKTLEQHINHEFTLNHGFYDTEYIAANEIEIELTLKDAKHNLTSISMNTLPIVADPHLLFQRPTNIYNVEKEYITQEIHKTYTDETIIAVPVYSINKPKVRDIRITSSQRKLPQNCNNITQSTRILSAEPVIYDHDRQCFEIDLAFIKKTTAIPLHAESNNTCSDVIAMHDIIVKTQSPKVKFFETNDNSYTTTCALSNIEVLREDCYVHELTRSKSAYIGPSQSNYKEQVPKSFINYSRTIDRMNVQSMSVARSYSCNTDYPSIQLTRMGNVDIFKPSDSTTNVRTLCTQRSFTLKTEKDLDEQPLEITIPKGTHHKNYVQSIDKYTKYPSNDSFSTNKYARPIYTLALNGTPLENKVTHTYSTNNQTANKHICIMPSSDYHIKDCSVEESVVPNLEACWELTLENQQQSSIPCFDSVDKCEKGFYATRPVDTISRNPIQSYLNRPQEEMIDLSSDAQIMKLHPRLGSTFKQPVNIQKSNTSITEPSVNNTYTSFLSIEGPSLPLRFDFSKPDYTVSIATFDDTIESSQSTKTNTLPKYTNFDTPSAIPSTLLTNEITFQTPETIAEGISTNILLYPQQTLQLREPIVESESGHAEPPTKTFTSNPIESDPQQLFTKSNFYIKSTEKTLDESVVVQECKKTDFIRTHIKLKHLPSNSTENEESVPFSIAIRHRKPDIKENPTNEKNICTSGTSRPPSRVANSSVPPSVSVSSSVSELLGHINAAIALSKDHISQDYTLPNELRDSTATSEAAIEFSAIPEYELQRFSRKQIPIKQLPCKTNYGRITDSLLDMKEKAPIQEPATMKQSVSVIKLEGMIDTKESKAISTEPISVTNLGLALPPSFPPSYKAAVIDRAVETRGPYLIKKTISEKNILATETTYSIKRQPINYSNASSSNSANSIQTEFIVGPIPSKTSSNPQSEAEFNNIMLYDANRSYKYQSPNTIQADDHSNSDNHSSVAVETDTITNPSIHTVNSQRHSNTYTEGISAIVQALQSLVDISKNNILYVNACNDSQKNVIDPLLWQEYIKKLEFLTNSVKLSSDTILDLKIAFQTLNDKLIDKIASDIKNSILTSDHSLSTATFSEKESVEILTSTRPTSTDYAPSIAVGTQAGLDTQSMPSANISRLEELQRLYRELTASKDMIEKYTNLIDSPASLIGATNSAATSDNILEKPFYPVDTGREAFLTNSDNHTPASTRRLEKTVEPPITNTYIHSIQPIETDTPQSYNHPHDPPKAPVFDRLPMQPKKEICLPVISTSFVTKIKREARRRKEASEDALLHSRTLGIYLRQVAYTEESIAKHVSFAIFNDIMDSITIECVESTKKLMGLQ